MKADIGAWLTLDASRKKGKDVERASQEVRQTMLMYGPPDQHIASPPGLGIRRVNAPRKKSKINSRTIHSLSSWVIDDRDLLVHTINLKSGRP